MCELSHVIRLVEFGRIDLVDRLGVDVVLLAIVALHEQAPSRQVLDDPASDESRLGVSEPDIALAGEVVLALDAAHFWHVLGAVGDELWGESAGGCAVAVRIGTQTGGVATTQQRTAQLAEGLVADVCHGVGRLVRQRR